MACDKRGWIVATTVDKGNKHDSVLFPKIYKKVKKNIGKPEAVVLDSGYKTPYIAKMLLDNSYMPYKRPHTKKGFFYKVL